MKDYTAPETPDGELDLVIRDLIEVYGYTYPGVGETVYLWMRIANQGDTAAEDVATVWRPYGIGHPADIHEFRVDRLGPGEDEIFSWDYEYDVAGVFESYAKVDYLSAIAESDEENNERTLTFDVYN